jgi:hypothetical protein
LAAHLLAKRVVAIERDVDDSFTAYKVLNVLAAIV